MTEQDLHAALRLLREEVGNLVKTVPGPVASVSVRLGECSLEVAWAGAAPEAPPAGQPVAEDPGLAVVTAPLVGTFYLAPEPGAPPFVRAGDRVEAGQTIGIVEAMKLMNPVAADCSGEVVEVVAGDAEPVEYGQELMRIRVDR
ncbi:acetyl-CoA carboxylase biotin carboxyl carrier protein [Nonomuraea typhae]|uniref:acetyl-CoA carboxylase biotin carboxyl carrier protein n=1 Tax=Nonomuraea typhae TaxID=2603600 RepID=UPI0012F9A024|nr:biotin/lipoyl-containing protein [Nonomuraea typhae]